MTHKPALLPVVIGTGFGAGFWPWGPGTAGSVVATALWFALHSVLPPAVLQTVTAALIVVFTIVGTWATRRLMPFWGDDPSRVVVDEMVGVWVALLVADDLWTAVAALLLFRFFDIVKPLGIRALDQRHGAFWVMADDLLAGLYAALVLAGIALFT
jgi:phosphatidylglycerophosphatase A